MRHIAIVGSREYRRLTTVRVYIAHVRYTEGSFHVVTGDALGVDTVAVRSAATLKMPYTVYPADWYPERDMPIDRGAGLKRNQLIVNAADEMVCFWDEVSHGTAHDIHLWYMKTGKQPLVIGGLGEQITVSHRQAQDILSYRGQKPLTLTETDGTVVHVVR